MPFGPLWGRGVGKPLLGAGRRGAKRLRGRGCPAPPPLAPSPPAPATPAGRRATPEEPRRSCGRRGAASGRVPPRPSGRRGGDPIQLLAPAGLGQPASPLLGHLPAVPAVTAGHGDGGRHGGCRRGRGRSGSGEPSVPGPCPAQPASCPPGKRLGRMGGREGRRGVFSVANKMN